MGGAEASPPKIIIPKPLGDPIGLNREISAKRVKKPRTMDFYSEFEKKLSLFSYCFILFNLISFTVILLFNTPLFTKITREDGFTEYLGCLFLFVTAVVLSGCAALFFKRKPPNYMKYGLLFLSASILFFWATGEEISWGQRIFGFSSPEIFQDKNIQREFNLHNFNTVFFNKSLQNINLLMILIPTILFYKNIKTVVGVPIPNIPMIFSLQVAMGYSTYLHINFHDPISIICLCFWVIYFYRQKNERYLLMAVSALLLILGVGTINYFMNEIIATNAPREIREYMFCFICMIYSINIFMYFKKELPLS